MENQQPSASDLDNDSGPKRLDFTAILDRVLSAPAMSDDQIADEARNERLAKRVEALRELESCAGIRVSACRLSNFVTSTDYQKQVVDCLREWVSTFEERRNSGDGIVLYGPVGTGKDHLAYGAVGSVVHTTGYSAKWVNGRELVGTIRDRISEESSEANFIRSMTNPAILVISDPLPPIGDLTQHQADMLYRICESRYGMRRITVATLNVASDEEADKRLGCATWDRLCHGAWKIACTWPSYRAPSRDMRPKGKS